MSIIKQTGWFSGCCNSWGCVVLSAGPWCDCWLAVVLLGQRLQSCPIGAPQAAATQEEHSWMCRGSQPDLLDCKANSSDLGISEEESV